MKKAFLSLLVLFISIQALAWYDPGFLKNTQSGQVTRPTRGGKADTTSKAADFWWVFFTGAGSLGDWVVSNTLQGGIFCRSPNEGPFDATSDQWNRVYTVTNQIGQGFTGEYPKGSRQFYTYAAGPWIGAERRFPGSDTAWHKVVSKGAYSSDLGAMYIPELKTAGEAGDIGGRGLAFSTQILPYNYDYPHEGELLFSQGGITIKEDYQAIWPFADTLINKRREDPTTHVHPDSGSIISQEDTYACAGDWIPEKDATCIWIRDAGKYDVRALGIRVEQRTYSWNYGYNNSYIYMNWKIRNMTNDVLRNLYVGYFMDNDIGHGSTNPKQGSEDDLIGFDTTYIPELGRHLDLGYTKDSDGYEEGWTTRAGYIGCVLCETPADTGSAPRMRAFQYWQRIGDVGEVIDRDMQDSVKYMVLGCKYYPERDSFMLASAPSDMRQLSCSGPRNTLYPGEEVDFTIAIVAAYTFDELKERSISALKQFQFGFLGYTPPPSPSLSVIPGDSMVYLSWDVSPENHYDKMAKEHTFEGYKVYRSLTGLPDTSAWNLLATYDLKSNTKDTVLVKYTIGSSKASISFEGLDTITKFSGTNILISDSLFSTNKYTFTFANPYFFSIRDSVNNTTYTYNKYAKDSASGGYCVMNTKGSAVYSSDPGYVSGAFIWIDGFYVKIQNGILNPDDPGASLTPASGDEFTVRSFNLEAIGSETQLEHYYIDRNVVNGKKYFYSVTSFSKPLPELNVPSLESGLSGKAYWAIPMKLPADYKGASASVIHPTGLGDIELGVSVVNPAGVKSDTLMITFLEDADIGAKYWKLENISTNTVLDTFSYFELEPLPTIYNALDIKLARVVATPTYDTANSGWQGKSSNWKVIASPKKVGGVYKEPYYDYDLIVSSTGSLDMDSLKAPFILWNTNLGATAYFKYLQGPSDTLKDGDNILVYNSKTDPQPRLQITIEKGTIEPTRSPKPGYIYNIRMLNRLTTLDTFKIISTPFDAKKDKYSLDNIRVVPNPYFIRASWDKSKYQRKIWFQGLPSECKIRIFNIAGLLVKTIEHNEKNISSMKDRNEISGPGAHAWDFLSNEGLAIANGLYIYQVTAPGGKKKIGKFAIVK